MKAATLHDTPLRETPLHDATPPNAAPPHVDEPDEAVHDIADEAIDVAMWANDAKHQVDAVVRDNPYASVAVAAGIGYVLGGGLPSWAVRMAVQAGTRLAVSAAVAALVTDPNPSSP